MDNELLYKKNTLIKNLEKVLKNADPRIRWVDYIPAHMLPFHKELVAIQYSENIKGVPVTKYVNITGKSLISLARCICNAVDDFCVEEMFLTEKNIESIKNSLEVIAKQRVHIVSQCINALSDESILSNKECETICDTLKNYGIIPSVFYIAESSARKILINYLNDGSASFLDTEIINETIHNIWDLKDKETEDYSK